MAFLLSSWSSNVKTLPADYHVVPAESRPGNPVRIGKEIPVIDLEDDAEPNRADLVQKIIKASQDFGLFQVINHGISEKLMFDGMNVGNEFFGLSCEEKEKLCNESGKSGEKGCKIYTSSGAYSKQDFKYWKDTLEHNGHPLEDYVNSWPEKPTRYREIIGAYITQVKKLSIRIMDMIYEGLRLEMVEIKELNNYEFGLTINHYPACPDPTSALGTKRHCDPNLITILQQDVYGLQLLKDGQWIGVEPIPNAFVVNIGLSLEVLSNGKLKGGIHRVVTNSACSRASIATFVNCPCESIIQPAKYLVNTANPQLYRAVKYKDFLEFLISNNSDYEAEMEYLKLIKT